MNKIICKYCGNKIDTDYIKEHEDECEENPANEMIERSFYEVRI